MQTLLKLCLFISLLSTATVALSDAPLKSKLELDTNQAKVVQGIQKRYRSEVRTVRQALNKESRKLRRAKSANDSTLIAQLELTVNDLANEMTSLILNEDDEIRQVLNAGQLEKFEEYIETRNAMAGSSRDVVLLKQ